MACRAAGHLGERVVGLGHVLEHLDRGRKVELSVGERQALGALGEVGEVRRGPLGPLGGEQRVVQIDADDARRLEQLGPPLRQDALAAADVQPRIRARATGLRALYLS